MLDELGERLREHALLEGDFVLRSPRSSLRSSTCGAAGRRRSSASGSSSTTAPR